MGDRPGRTQTPRPPDLENDVIPSATHPARNRLASVFRPEGPATDTAAADPIPSGPYSDRRRIQCNGGAPARLTASSLPPAPSPYGTPPTSNAMVSADGKPATAMLYAAGYIGQIAPPAPQRPRVAPGKPPMSAPAR